MGGTSIWTVQRRVLNVFAISAMIATFGLLMLGGLVTSYQVGMAVPDWPTTFNENMFSYYFFDKGWGIQLEHSHRLVAAGVGLATIVLGVCIGCIERRLWVLGLGALAIALVILQGVLGGMRVRLNEIMGTDLAALHGCVAQLFFALMVSLAVVTSRWWVEAVPAPHEDARRLRRLALGLAVVAYCQIVLGASVRHYGSGPMFVLHLGLAGLLFMGVVWTGLMVLTDPPLRLKLGTPVVVLLLMVGVQILLGLAAMSLTELTPPALRESISTAQAATATAHLLCGAVVFATTVVLALRCARVLAPGRSERLDSNLQRALETVG